MFVYIDFDHSNVDGSGDSKGTNHSFMEQFFPRTSLNIFIVLVSIHKIIVIKTER